MVADSISAKVYRPENCEYFNDLDGAFAAVMRK
jgi:hypothetical protein